VARFFRIKRTGRAFSDRSKATVPRANIAAKHESRGAIRPAFKDVWAAGFLTNRVQVETLNQFHNVVLVGGIAQTNLQPVGFWPAGLRDVADDA